MVVLSKIGWSCASLCVPLVSLLVSHFRFPPIWLLVLDLGLPLNRLVCAMLGLAPINLLGCRSCLVCEYGRWSYGWGLAWYKGDGYIPNLDGWERCVCGESVELSVS